MSLSLQKRQWGARVCLSYEFSVSHKCEESWSQCYAMFYTQKMKFSKENFLRRRNVQNKETCIGRTFESEFDSSSKSKEITDFDGSSKK